MIQILRTIRLLQSCLVVDRLPQTTCSKAAAMAKYFPHVPLYPCRACTTIKTWHSQLSASPCCCSTMLQYIPPRNLQKWQAWLSGRMARMLKKGMVPTWTISLRLKSRYQNHTGFNWRQRVAGCETCVAIAKKSLCKELKSLSIIAYGTQTLPEAMKSYRGQLQLFQTTSRPLKQAFCQELSKTHR